MISRLIGKDFPPLRIELLLAKWFSLGGVHHIKSGITILKKRSIKDLPGHSSPARHKSPQATHTLFYTALHTVAEY